MKTYNVAVPITGVIYVSVDAENEEEAIRAALHGDLSLSEIEEWEATRQVVRGNVFYGVLNEANAEEES